VGRELAGKTEVLGVNLPQCHFGQHTSHMKWPRIQTRAFAVGSWRLNARAFVRPNSYHSIETQVETSLLVCQLRLAFLEATSCVPNQRTIYVGCVNLFVHYLTRLLVSQDCIKVE
jgi:hypothetical protein